jgi:hypothetical protein
MSNDIEAERKLFEDACKHGIETKLLHAPRVKDGKEWKRMLFDGWLLSKYSALSAPQQEPVVRITPLKCRGPQKVSIEILADRWPDVETLLYAAPTPAAPVLSAEDMLLLEHLLFLFSGISCPETAEKLRALLAKVTKP